MFTAEYEDECRPVDALLKGLDDLYNLCEVVTEKFTDARDSFGKKYTPHPGGPVPQAQAQAQDGQEDGAEGEMETEA
jgi:hypothetical protein